MIIFFGDVHFDDSHDYFLEASKKFLDYFDQLPENNSSNIAVFLGDLTEKFLVSGQVYNFLNQLLVSRNRFKKTYILVGNHDLRKYGGKELLVYEFAKNYQSIQILDNPAEIVDIDGLKVLSMPHFIYKNFSGKLSSMVEYYNNLPGDIVNQSYDLVIGHFTDSSFNQSFRMKDVIDISPIQAKKVILGHIHRRVNERYIGSIFPLSADEEDLSRSLIVYDNGEWREKRLPEFLKFVSVSYPEPLTIDSDAIIACTVFNCTKPEFANMYCEGKENLIFIKKTFPFSKDDYYAHFRNSATGVSDFENFRKPPSRLDFLKKYFEVNDTNYNAQIKELAFEILSQKST